MAEEITLNGKKVKVTVGVLVALLGILAMGMVHLVWANTTAIGDLRTNDAVTEERWRNVDRRLTDIQRTVDLIEEKQR